MPLIIGKVRVNPGDIIYRDCDGMLCAPRAQEVEVINAALDNVR